MNRKLGSGARGTATSEKSPVFSAGFVAPLNLNFSTGDPLAGFRPSAAVEPFVVIRQPKPAVVIRGRIPARGVVSTADQLGWTPAFTQKLRSSLAPFAEDWNDPTMEVYDDAE